MPIYEYHCGQCQSEFELLVRAHERPVCPTCGGEDLDKQWSVPAAHSSSSRELPISSTAAGPCGRPECGLGGCQGF
jgi:putative FmdB family regulatory protein